LGTGGEEGGAPASTGEDSDGDAWEGVATAREEDAGAGREPFSRTSDRIHLTLTVNVHSSFEIRAY
jgi:hypothetical protein